MKLPAPSVTLRTLNEINLILYILLVWQMQCQKRGMGVLEFEALQPTAKHLTFSEPR